MCQNSFFVSQQAAFELNSLRNASVLHSIRRVKLPTATILPRRSHGFDEGGVGTGRGGSAGADGDCWCLTLIQISDLIKCEKFVNCKNCRLISNKYLMLLQQEQQQKYAITTTKHI